MILRKPIQRPARSAVRAAQDRERGGMTPADWDAAEPAIEAAERQRFAAYDDGERPCGRTTSCDACLDAIGGQPRPRV